MKRFLKSIKIIALIICLLFSTSLIACLETEKQEGKEVYTPDFKIDFSKGLKEDVKVDVGIKNNEKYLLRGKNLLREDYFVNSENKLVIKSDYLEGIREKESKLIFETGEKQFKIQLVSKEDSCEYQIANGGFELGSLRYWEEQKIFEESENMMAFSQCGVKKNKPYFIINNYNGDGKFLYGFDDDIEDGRYNKWGEKVGILKSQPFKMEGSGFITFKLGGGKNSSLNYISIKEVESGKEVKRFANSLYNGREYKENMVEYIADLSDLKGKNLYIEICDYGSGLEDFMTFDSFVTFYKDKPTNESLVEAKNILPGIAYVDNASKNLRNGDFESFLSDMTIAYGDGFLVSDGVLKSSKNGDDSIGTLRTSAFTLEGSGYISFEIGAGCGANYQKNTVILVKEVETNNLVARYSNLNHKGEKLNRYFADLSSFKGKKLYLEIVDNEMGDYGVIFVDNIITFYEEIPVFNPIELATNTKY